MAPMQRKSLQFICRNARGGCIFSGTCHLAHARKER